LILSGIVWWGRLDEVGFLRRLYPLDNIPSEDNRYDNVAEEIVQHCVRNDDWPITWIFTDKRFRLETDDEKFLAFLSATVHPAVRPDESAASDLVAMYNHHLAPDGWELAETSQISGRPVYGPRQMFTVPSALKHVEQTAPVVDREYLDKQIARMESAIERDPELAIGTAKELIETVCKTILSARGFEPDKDWNLAKLVSETSKKLQVTPADV